jgi:preprotein translocase subunit SecG
VTTLLITVHVLSCIMLILVVLLQAGRGADMGAAFGGASTPMFGSGSSTNPLTRITTITAVAFLTTALFLAVGSARRASVFDNAAEPLAAPPRAESTVPVTPQAAVPAESPQAAVPAETPPAAAPAETPQAQPLTIPAPAAGAAPANDKATGGEATDVAPAGEAAPAAAPSAAGAPPEAAKDAAAPAAAPAAPSAPAANEGTPPAGTGAAPAQPESAPAAH